MALLQCNELSWFQKFVLIILAGVAILIPGIVMTVLGQEQMTDNSTNALIVIGPIFLAIGGLAFLASTGFFLYYIYKKDDEVQDAYHADAAAAVTVDADILPPSNEDSDRAFEYLGEFTPGVAHPNNDIAGPSQDLNYTIDMQPDTYIHAGMDSGQKY